MTKIPTSSEEKLLQEHGYKLIKKIGEGGYAKVDSLSCFPSSCI